MDLLATQDRRKTSRARSQRCRSVAVRKPFRRSSMVNLRLASATLARSTRPARWLACLPAVLTTLRAPCEYEKGHVPGAVSFPLFDDAERAEVGTLYKQEGHDVAVARGLELVDRKLPSLLNALPPRLQ